jgi:AAA domain/Winged helix DNA-binding domain
MRSLNGRTVALTERLAAQTLLRARMFGANPEAAGFSGQLNHDRMAQIDRGLGRIWLEIDLLEENGEIVTPGRIYDSLGPEDRDLARQIEFSGEAEAIEREHGLRRCVRLLTRGLRLITDKEIESLPTPDYLIDGIITAGGLAVLYGPPASGKTFIALDIAFRVGSGMPWFGHAVKQGPAVYVAAEGIGSIKARVRAWKHANAHEETPVGVNFLPQAISLMDAVAVDELLVLIAELRPPPELIVFDTLARCMVGGDENSTKDMSASIANVDRIRLGTGATVMLLHHTNKGGDLERGNTALRGAADTMIAVRTDDGIVALTSEKQKDGPAFDRILLRLVPELDTCVLTANVGLAANPRDLTAKQWQALQSLQTSFFQDEEVATSKWLAVSGLEDRTFYQSIKRLITRGYVNRTGKQRSTRYVLTAAGAAALGANCKLTAI